MSFKESIQSIFRIDPKIFCFVGGGICIFYSFFIHFITDFQKNIFDKISVPVEEIEPFQAVHQVLGDLLPYLFAYGCAFVLFGFLIKPLGKLSSIFHLAIVVAGLVGLFYYFSNMSSFYEGMIGNFPEEIGIVKKVMKMSMYGSALSMLLGYSIFHVIVAKSIQYKTRSLTS